jgi:putative ABC transport system ATP-binding protein
VAIARALIHGPGVVLADEPTASVGTERTIQVVETFASLNREQYRAGIMVTHDLRMCQHVDRVIQTEDGKVTRIIEEQDQIRALADMRKPRQSEELIATSYGPSILQPVRAAP